VELYVDLVTRPQPVMRTRVVVLVIVIVTVFVLSRAGNSLPDAITMVLGAGLTGTAVARSLLPGRAATRLCQ
jgi:hypothetical protein